MWGKETLLIDDGSEIGVSTMEVSLKCAKEIRNWFSRMLNYFSPEVNT